MKEQVFMKDEATQVEWMNTTISSKGSSNTSPKNSAPLENKKVDSSKYDHDKAYSVLEELEEKIGSLDDLYKRSSELVKLIDDADNYNNGFSKAILQYKQISFNNENEQKFLLLQFLEEFYEKYAIFDSSHTQNQHDLVFHDLVNMSYLEYPLLLGDIIGENHHNVD